MKGGGGGKRRVCWAAKATKCRGGGWAWGRGGGGGVLEGAGSRFDNGPRGGGVPGRAGTPHSTSAMSSSPLAYLSRLASKSSRSAATY